MPRDPPPGPTLDPHVQSMHWFARPLEFLEECRAAYGDCFTLDFAGFGRHLCFSKPAAIRDVLSAPPAVLLAGAGNRPLEPLLGESSLLLLDGARHRDHRRLLAPAFQGPRLAVLAELIATVAREAIEAWPVGAPFAVHPHLVEVSLEVILRALFGPIPRERLLFGKQAFEQLLQLPGLSLQLFRDVDEDLPATERLRVRVDETHTWLASEIARLRSGDDVPASSILAELAAARLDDGSRLTDAELQGELMTLIIAGHETTASALAWAVHCIGSTPAVLDRLLDELEEASADAILDSRLLHAACLETLRMYPVIPVVSRLAAAPYEVQGILLEPGDHTMLCIYLTHHDEALYPEPSVFRPERFMEGARSPYEYLPFGGGRRRCLGMGLAVMEMQVVLGTLLARRSIELVDPASPRAVRSALMVVPSGGVQVRLTRRGA